MEMHGTFTTVVRGVVVLGYEAWDIHHVVQAVKGELLVDQPKANTVRVTYSLVDRGEDKHHLAVVTLLNVRRRELDMALVWCEQPMEARRQYHANDHIHYIACKECGNSMFYNVDRSLDYENHICAVCGASAHTLTETGASA